MSLPRTELDIGEFEIPFAVIGWKSALTEYLLLNEDYQDESPDYLDLKILSKILG